MNSPTFPFSLFLLQDVSEKRIPIMLCANKVDLRMEACAAGRKCVSTDEGEKTARDHSAIFIETSAKDGKNVFDALVHLARSVTPMAPPHRHKCFLFVYDLTSLLPAFALCCCHHRFGQPGQRWSSPLQYSVKK